MTSQLTLDSDERRETLRAWGKAAALGGAIVFFPFARSYYLFYLILLVWALVAAGPRQLWRESAGLRYALYAIGLPIVVTTLANAVLGEARGPWLEKAGLVALAALLGAAAAWWVRDEDTARRATLIMVIAIVSWIGEGVLQVLAGNDIDCRFQQSTCWASVRESLYFARKSKVGYFIGMMALVPACWFLARRRIIAAVAVMVGAGAVAMAAGSRFAMLAFLLSSVALAFLASVRLGRWRWLLVLGVSVLIFLFSILLYYSNEGFQARVDMTLGLFQGNDYATLNRALSGRLDIWVPVWSLIQDNWLFGVGAGDLDSAVRPYLQPGNLFTTHKVFHSHQVLLDVWVATGIIGLGAFLGFYGWAAWRAVRLAGTGISMQWAWLMVFLVMWFPLNSGHGFYSSEMVLLTFFALGLGLSEPGGPRGTQPPVTGATAI